MSVNNLDLNDKLSVNEDGKIQETNENLKNPLKKDDENSEFDIINPSQALEKEKEKNPVSNKTPKRKNFIKNNIQKLKKTQNLEVKILSSEEIIQTTEKNKKDFFESILPKPIKTLENTEKLGINLSTSKFSKTEIKISEIFQSKETKKIRAEHFPFESQKTAEKILKNTEDHQREKNKEITAPKRSSSRAENRDLSSEITTSIKSQQVLANKFTKEFNAVLSKANINSDEIDYNTMVLVLQNMNFIKNDPKSKKFEEESLMVLKL